MLFAPNTVLFGVVQLLLAWGEVTRKAEEFCEQFCYKLLVHSYLLYFVTLFVMV